MCIIKLFQGEEYYEKHETLLATALIAACALSQPVLAQSVEPTALPSATLDATDLSFAFEQTAQPVQMAMLSEQEMKETEGAVLVGGALLGFGIYGGSTVYRSWDFSSNYGINRNTLNNLSNNWSTSDALFATASGAVGGAYGQALFRGVGYTGFWSQIAAPVTVQVPIRTGSAGLGFSTFGVHGYSTTNFNNSNNNFFPRTNFYCGACYRGR